MTNQIKSFTNTQMSRRGVLRAGAGVGAAGAMALLLAACGSPGGTTETTGLKMTFLDVVKRYVDGALAAYEKQSGTSVKLGLVPGEWTDLATRINAERQAGKAPDFSLLGVGFIGGLAARGQLTDLAPLVAKAGIDLDALVPASIERWRDGDKLWALPAATFTQAMYYNKTLFDKAGIEPPSADWNNPWTFDQWRSAAEAMTDGNGTYGTWASLTPERACQYLWANDADVFSADGKTFEMASDKAIETYEFLAAFERDGLAPSTDLIASGGVGSLFAAGRVGIFLEGSWLLGELASQNLDFEVGVAPSPAGSSGKAFTPLWNDSWIIPQGVKNPEKSIDVLKFMTSEEGLTILTGANAMNGIAPMASVNEANLDNMFAGMMPERKQVWLDSLDHTRNYYFAPNYAEVLNAFDQELALIPSGDKTPAEALRALKEQVQPLLDQNA